MKPWTTNQYHCSLEFRLSALYHKAHYRTCPHTSIDPRHHDTVLVDKLHRQYTLACIRHLKEEHLMPVIGLCPAGSELVYFLREIPPLWRSYQKRPNMYLMIMLQGNQSSRCNSPTLLKTRDVVVPRVYVHFHRWQKPLPVLQGFEGSLTV